MHNSYVYRCKIRKHVVKKANAYSCHGAPASETFLNMFFPFCFQPLPGTLKHTKVHWCTSTIVSKPALNNEPPPKGAMKLHVDAALRREAFVTVSERRVQAETLKACRPTLEQQRRIKTYVSKAVPTVGAPKSFLSLSKFRIRG